MRAVFHPGPIARMRGREILCGRNPALLPSGVADSPAQVLYLEDQPVVGAIILLELRRNGVEATTVHGVEHALELSRGKKFDLILLDVLLNGTTGFEACRRLRTDDSLKDLPVIFFTGVPNAEDERQAMRLGAVAYLDKAADTQQLAERILTEVQLARTAATGRAKG